MTTAETAPATDFAAARRAMIDSQLRTSGVNTRWVLDAMFAAPREEHVPQAKRGHAYMDRAIALGDGGWLAAPVVHGMMLEEAAPLASDRALVIDNGSGYLAALLRPLVGALTVESPEVAATRRKRDELDLIIIDGAVEHIPAVLAKRLARDGRLIAGLADRGVTRLARGRRSGDAVALLPLRDLGIPHLPAFDRAQGWSF